MHKGSFMKNFIIGFGSVLDLFPKPAKTPPRLSARDQLQNNWQRVGGYLRAAIEADKNNRVSESPKIKDKK